MAAHWFLSIPWRSALVAAALAIFTGPAGAGGWTQYGADAHGTRYSAADEITPQNVTGLKEAWRFDTGHLDKPYDGEVAFEGTPVLIAGSLVLCTPFNEVIALDPGTGRERWRFDPDIPRDQDPANQFICRGVSTWTAPDPAEADAACGTRIFMATNDAKLWALDARTGTPCAGFGTGGAVAVPPDRALVWAGEYQITSPPAVIGGAVVVGSAISDNIRLQAPAGVVRAFDVRSGAPLWSFDPIPRDPDSPAAATWDGEGRPLSGHANVWSIMSADEERGLVFLPTSSASPDFYGGDRPGDNLYANSVVALDAATGTVRWHFQTVRHDVWDYDLPAQPGLYEITRNGQTVPVVVQATKTGFVFVLDRETGEPVFEVEDRPVPQTPAIGEALSRTQPFPVAPRALVPHEISPDDAWGLTPWDRGACKRRMEGLRNDGLFTPPSRTGTLMVPFSGGGANWGSMAFDPERQWAFVNTNRMMHEIRLIRPETADVVRADNPGLEVGRQMGTRYAVTREVILSPLGLPCNPPPWGMLHAIDLKSGLIVWESVLGTTRDIAPLGLAFDYGTPNFGGPIVTKGGVLFIGAAMDNYLRAFDVQSGTELWKGRLPAGGQATPMTYDWQGRQYVVIASGGHQRAGTKIGDSVVAFALE